MSGYTVTEKLGSREKSGDSAKVSYIVGTTTREGPERVVTTPSLPRFGDAWQEPGMTDTTLVCTWPPDAKLISPDNELWWEVGFTYTRKTSDLPGGGFDLSRPEDPIARILREPTQWAFSGTYVDLYLTHDVTGQPFVNTAGHPLDGISTPVPTGVISATRNELTFDPFKADEYRGKVNSDAWRGFPPETVLCWDIRANNLTADIPNRPQPFQYWQVSYEFHTLRLKDHAGKELGWKVELINRGPYSMELNSSGERKIALPSEMSKQKFAGIVPLDVDGAARRYEDLFDSAGKLKSDAYTWLTFIVRNRTSFTALRL